MLDQLLASLDAPASRIVFDHGVETFRSADGRWRVPHPLGELAAPAADPHALATGHGLRPVVLVTGGALGAESGRLVSAAGTLGWRPLVERLYEDGTTAGDALRLRFALDALEHHCTRLAHAYVAVNAAARRLMTMFGSRELQVLSGQPEPYYELDAVLACAARAYAAVRSLAWSAFGDEGLGHARRRSRRPAPRHVDELVRASRRMPPVLREALRESWDAYGATVTPYRRCLHHLNAADFGYASVRLRRLDDDLWAVTIPLPDNPDAGSRTRYAFTRRLDALHHGWALTTEVMRLVSLTVFAITDPALDEGVRFGRPDER